MPVSLIDPHQLHRGLRELIALSALPAAWRSTPTNRIPESLADIVLRSLGAQLVFVRLLPDAQGSVIEALRQHRDDNEETRQFAAQGIGLGGEMGLLVAASSQPDFPTEMDHLLLEVAANQAASVLQQRRAEERLHAAQVDAERSAERLRLALDAGLMGAYEHDHTTDTQWWSPELYSLFGVSPEHFKPTNDSFSALVPPEDMDSLRTAFRQGIANRQPFIYEFRILRPDGHVRWMGGQGTIECDGDGNPIRHVGVVQDITERKRAEERLRLALAQAEEATRRKDEYITSVSNELRWTAAVVEHANDAIIGKDLDGIIVSWNPGAQALYGYTAAEMIGRHISAVAPPERCHEAMEILEQIKRGEMVHRDDTERVTKRGDRIDVSITASGVRDANGTLTGASVIARDIGERKRAERRLRALLEAAPDAMVIVDASGCIQMVNRQVEGLLGYRPDELLRQPVETLVPGHARQMHVAHRHKYVPSARPRPMGAGLELAAVRKDGTEVPVEISLSPVATEEGTLVVAAIRDVTDRRRRERELREAEAKLAHISRVATMGELASSIAHEINQPLAAIVNDGAACLRWLQCHPPALSEATESVQHIIGDANRASHVIARIRSLLARKPSTKSRFDANELVRETEVLVKGEVARIGATLRTELTPALPLVMGDRVQIQQVLLNLLMNALEATSRITTGSREVTVASSSGGSSTVIIAVHDSGVGIPRDVRERIFDAFYTTKPEGLGMGLAISRSIIEEHGGHLWAVETEGAGAIVQFTIPIAEEET